VVEVRRWQTWLRELGERLLLQWHKNSLNKARMIAGCHSAFSFRSLESAMAIFRKAVNCSQVSMMLTFQKMNFYCCMMLTVQQSRFTLPEL